jgi:APA family basic amino acid/polyamine antiporter
MSNHFHRSLNLYDATMLVAGSMIGSGIFIVSADIARTVGSSGYLMLVWILGGLMTMIAAISYGELAAMYPNVGGQYVYLKKAYGSMVAFLFGWSYFGVIESGVIAAVGVAFAKFTAVFFPFFSEKNYLVHWGSFHFSGAQFLGILMIVVLTFNNIQGLKNGKWIQTIFTSTKIIALIGIVLLGLFLGGHPAAAQNFAHPFDGFTIDASGNMLPLVGYSLAIAIGTSMVGSLFSSDAWNNVTFIAGEIKEPQRNVPLSLFFGTLIVSTLYILTNYTYLSVLSLEQIRTAEMDRVGVTAITQMVGDSGTYLMAALIMISTFGCNNGLILAGARLYFTMAKDKLFFEKAGTLNKKGVPQYALIAQCIWSCLLCLTGSYGALLDYTIFAALIFYIFTIAAIFVLRKKEPDTPRPYKAFGYPIIPFAYMLGALVIALILLVYKWDNTKWGLLIVCLGIPVYYLIRKPEEP